MLNIKGIRRYSLQFRKELNSSRRQEEFTCNLIDEKNVNNKNDVMYNYIILTHTHAFNLCKILSPSVAPAQMNFRIR